MANPNIDTPKLSLKVVINKQKTKVLYAEANTDFMNVLLSFLTLPFVKVVRILREHYGESAPAIGSLNTLCTSLLNLDVACFCVGGAKQMLLNPRSSLRAECRKLVVDITDSQPNQYFLCQDLKCPEVLPMNVSLYSDIASCRCGKSLNRELRMAESLDGVAFITSPSSFIITDDLSVVDPMTGIIQMLNNLGTTDTQGAEMLTVSFGIDEIKDLLKFSLTSATPLTDLIFKKTRMSSTAVCPKSGIFLDNLIQRDDANSRRIVLKVCLQRSTNKFLFAIATAEFVELLFSFLTVPLGGVEFPLGGKTGLKNIDNLYRSVSNGIYDEYFTVPETKSKLVNPKLPHGYISKNQFLPLSEEAPPKLYYQLLPNQPPKLHYQFLPNQPPKLHYQLLPYQFSESYSFNEKKVGSLVTSFKLNKELYVKKQTKCIVTDDLTVSTNLTTSLLIINGLGIPLSDVKEMELHVGLEEALSILKASLTSKTAITDGLIKPMLNKQPKLERQPKQER